MVPPPPMAPMPPPPMPPLAGGMHAGIRSCVLDGVKECLGRLMPAADQAKLLVAAEIAYIVDTVHARMVRDRHTALDEDDLQFIRLTATRMAKARLPHAPRAARRFRKHDRVVCHTGGRRAWAAGTVIELNRADPEDPTGQTQLAYLVKIDPPNQRVVCVPWDGNDVVRTEVCYGQADLSFTLFCKPRQQSKTRRFVVGDRVACAVESATGDDIAWAAGTVADVNFDVWADGRKVSTSCSLHPAWPSADGLVPYRVLLDAGGHVFVHRDEHWLLRDLRLQPAGPAESVGGTRSRSRFASRREGDVRLWTPQQTRFFPRQFQAAALATLCTAHRLRTHPPPGVSASLGDLPPELLIVIIAASTGAARIDHKTRQIVF